MPCIVSCGYRSKLRAKYGLIEDPAPDWLTHCLFEWCALCQEYRELNNRGLDPSIGIAFYSFPFRCFSLYMILMDLSPQILHLRINSRFPWSRFLSHHIMNHSSNQQDLEWQRIILWFVTVAVGWQGNLARQNMMQAQVGMVPPMDQRMMPWCANVHHKGHGCNLRLPILIFSIFFFFFLISTTFSM
jgi:hypothetical protein